jgi:hypothetical protein
MIQRIQTVYLFFVGVLMSIAAILPVAEFVDTANKTLYQLDYRGILQMNSNGTVHSAINSNPTSFLFGIILIINTIAIFKYKNRKQQFRLTTINFILILIYIILLAVDIYLGLRKIAGSDLLLKIPVVLPVIALIVDYLAMRGISKDENLVKSMDRLR